MKIDCSPIVICEIKLALTDAIQYCENEGKFSTAERFEEIYKQFQYIDKTGDETITIV